MKKIIAMLMVVALATVGLAGCKTEINDETNDKTKTETTDVGGTDTEGKTLSGQINLSGSTSMEKIAKALAEGFMLKNENVTVDVQLGGSSAGVVNVKDGVSDIGNVSRAIKDSEKQEGLNEYKVAIDGIAVIVNKNNKVVELSKDQIASIFKGEITNWSDVGGDDAEIVVVGREAGSGTRDGFEEIVGVKDEAQYKSELNETGQVKNLVATTPGAIGYVSLDYVDDSIITVKVDGAEATAENIKSGAYPLQRPFMMITMAETEQAKAFIEYILSAEGQEIIVLKGCISVLD
ncbi:MAG: phosphate transporter substrate-binding protein [Clostridiales bacterium]|jgi:phosphate transport system substrate-binding protein|nr:phosphate transporter substrate-binding protein [Clostridiales bacterium]